MYKNVNKIVLEPHASETPGIKALVSTGYGRGELGKSGLSEPVYVPKTWGHEMIHVNNELYCSKTLFIKKGCHTSMHFHIDKHETMIVIEGRLYIDYIYNKEVVTHVLEKGEAFVIAPGLPHSLRADEIQSAIIIESSTTSNNEDSIRLPEELCYER